MGSIVLDETAWAKKMIESRTLGKKPYETLRRVARYYFDKGYSKKEVRKMLDIFLLQCDPGASLTQWSDTMDIAAKNALKYNSLEIDGVEVTSSEMDIIGSLGSVQLQRLAFTLLCLSKYWDFVNPGGDHWVNNKDSEIMRMANINTSVKRQCLLYHDLEEAGLIQFSKKIDNTNVKVLFSGGGKPAMLVSDFRNLGHQYMLFRGNRGYYRCQNCGVVVKRPNGTGAHGAAGRPPKYCKECAVELHIKRAVNSVMRPSGAYKPRDKNVKNVV